MSVTIDMSKKIDSYIAAPVKLSDDLDTQLLAWKAKLIRPFSDCYRSAVKQSEDRLKQAKLEDDKAKKEAKEMVEVGMAISLFVIDIFASAAVSKIAGAAGRLQSKKSLDHFVKSSESAGAAAVKFLSQGTTMQDVIIGNIATKSLGKLKSTATDAFKKEAMKAGQSAQQTGGLTGEFKKGVKNPEAFASAQLAYYEGRIHDAKVVYANGIRDNGGLSTEQRRALVTLFVTMPLCRPPLHAFPADAMVGYVESILWLHHCLRIQAAAHGGFGHLGGGEPGLKMRIARQVNMALRPTGKIITHRGVATHPGSLSGMEWDGHVGPYHVGPITELAKTTGGAIDNIVSNMTL